MTGELPPQPPACDCVNDTVSSSLPFLSLHLSQRQRLGPSRKKIPLYCPSGQSRIPPGPRQAPLPLCPYPISSYNSQEDGKKLNKMENDLKKKKKKKTLHKMTCGYSPQDGKLVFLPQATLLQSLPVCGEKCDSHSDLPVKSSLSG